MYNSLGKSMRKDTYIKYSKNIVPTIQEILIPQLSNLEFDIIIKKIPSLKDKYFYYIEQDRYNLYDDKIILLESSSRHKIIKKNHNNRNITNDFAGNKIYKIEENIKFKNTMTTNITNSDNKVDNSNMYTFIIQEKNIFKTQINYIPYYDNFTPLDIERNIFKLTNNSDILFIFEKHAIFSNKAPNIYHKFFIETHNNTSIDDIMTQEIIIAFIQTIN